jgi:hypothetical protein
MQNKAKEVFNKLAQLIKEDEFVNTDTPVGITVSASGDSFIVTFSQRYMGEVFSDFDEAVSYIDNFITNARKGENA